MIKLVRSYSIIFVALCPHCVYSRLLLQHSCLPTEYVVYEVSRKKMCRFSPSALNSTPRLTEQLSISHATRGYQQRRRCRFVTLQLYFSASLISTS